MVYNSMVYNSMVWNYLESQWPIIMGYFGV